MRREVEVLADAYLLVHTIGIRWREVVGWVKSCRVTWGQNVWRGSSLLNELQVLELGVLFFAVLNGVAFLVSLPYRRSFLQFLHIPFLF